MFLRVSPAIPVVWRDSDTVQFGLDPVRTTLGPVDLTRARGISELVRGTTLTRLSSLLGGESAARTLIGECGDVFGVPSHAAAPRLGVVGVTPSTTAVVRAWEGASSSTVVAPTSSEITHLDLDVVVLVSHFVVSPTDVQPWLGRDIPHVSIVFGESSVRVGPWVSPGTSACLRCIELAHIDSDPSWSAIAPQVWRRNAAADTPVLAAHAAAESLGLAAMGGGFSVRIDAVTHARVTALHSLHPACGCRAITETKG